MSAPERRGDNNSVRGAERRFGELIVKQKEEGGGLASAGRPKKIGTPEVPISMEAESDAEKNRYCRRTGF